MTIREAASILKEMYSQGAACGERTTQIHLFGIKYAEQIEGMSLPELLILADMQESYQTEIRKGMRLARHVEVRN